jgi:transposase InsO family protein
VWVADTTYLPVIGGFIFLVAIIESFFSTLEFEGPSTTIWRYVTDGEPELFTFIERYYNQTRLHSHNRYRTPNETENALRDGALAA